MNDLGSIQLLTIDQVATALVVSKSWVYKRIAKGVLPAIKVGHRLRIRREVVEAYVDVNEYRPEPEGIDWVDFDALRDEVESGN